VLASLSLVLVLLLWIEDLDKPLRVDEWAKIEIIHKGYAPINVLYGQIWKSVWPLRISSLIKSIRVVLYAVAVWLLRIAFPRLIIAVLIVLGVLEGDFLIVWRDLVVLVVVLIAVYAVWDLHRSVSVVDDLENTGDSGGGDWFG
jgi:hypothetical protein